MGAYFYNLFSPVIKKKKQLSLVCFQLIATKLTYLIPVLAQDATFEKRSHKKYIGLYCHD